MKKQQKDAKTMLFENMAKLNGVKISLNEDEKWIQKAVDPEHKGYCTPMSKPTCTPKRKALAKRFKKGIEDEAYVPGEMDNKKKAELLKGKIDFLMSTNHFDIIEKLDNLIDRMFPQSDHDMELAEEVDLQTKFRAEVAGKGENVWSTNDMEFNTEQEAQKWLDDLSGRWFGYDMGRVVPVSTPTRQPVDLENDVIYQNYRR
ncbi:MAG: hypothetical protein WC333_01325 [Dehalococcoidia bacterium]|jgi:hypothetical protein